MRETISHSSGSTPKLIGAAIGNMVNEVAGRKLGREFAAEWPGPGSSGRSIRNP
jgi:hypothetical protein